MTSATAPSTVILNGKVQGATPIQIRLARRRGEQIIRIESPGYFPFEIQVGPDTSVPNLLKSALVGAVIGGMAALAEATWEPHRHLLTGLAVDVPVGAALFFLIDLVPHEGKAPRTKELVVNLRKTDHTPRVDTMSLDAEEFRRIKWIRIRLQE